MSYTRHDFSESMDRATITPEHIAKVIAAWGESDGEWSGGFVLALKDGRFAYLTGWCDTTGWGCRDGASIAYFASCPAYQGFTQDDDNSNAGPSAIAWDEAPADLNRWLDEGAPHDNIY